MSRFCSGSYPRFDAMLDVMTMARAVCYRIQLANRLFPNNFQASIKNIIRKTMLSGIIDLVDAFVKCIFGARRNGHQSDAVSTAGLWSRLATGTFRHVHSKIDVAVT
jgi:hypothetical protein